MVADHRSLIVPSLGVLLLTLLGLATPALAENTCADLAGLKLPDTTMRSVTIVPAGAFPIKDLPAFCRVQAEVKSAPDSDIKVEVWLPDAPWGGVFHGVGNGGYAGALDAGYPGMAAGLRRGYVAATTDTGTAPAHDLDGDALAGHPRKWKDWGLYSTHVMTVTGKAIARSYYGRGAVRAYYTGCSTGGQQGLIEALHYPADYDGLLIGAPAVNRTWAHAMSVWDYKAANLEPGHLLTQAKLGVLHAAVLKTCGGLGSGLASDPVLDDPSVCRFDPASLICTGADAPNCLTPAEVQTAKAYYSGPTNHAGKPLYYGWALGGEEPGPAGWSFTENRPDHHPAFDGMFKWVFGPGWDWRNYDVERDQPKVEAVVGPSVNGATHGDLRALEARGGKVILYQGWADPLIAPAQTIAFYKKQAKMAGGLAKTQRFTRLFLAPGVSHCAMGDGPNAFNAAMGPLAQPPSNDPQHDLFAALSHWVEDGVAPEAVIATRYVDNNPAKGVAVQRPLCPYPQKAWYRGAGDPNVASNFVCALSKPS